MRKYQLLLGLFLCSLTGFTQSELIINTEARETISLNGKWGYIMDPYETGFYNYRWLERSPGDREAYWNSEVPDDKSDRKEHGFTKDQTLNVPGDWNHQGEKFLYYEGAMWYQRYFNFPQTKRGKKVYLYFGAVNYQCHAFLNGKKLGMHKGGFTPFNFEVPDSLLKTTGNNLVVLVNNKRLASEVPTINTDWWNYGGITRDVKLILLPQTSITSYSVSLLANQKISVSAKFSQPVNQKLSIRIPELGILEERLVSGTEIKFEISSAKDIQRWSPGKPKLYNIIISSGSESVNDKIGFRTIETRGSALLLNGKPIFLRGICMHEEIAASQRRAHSRSDDLRLLTQAKDLGVNMVRLAHYPYNDYMARVADSMGILLWAEIPVYWTIDFGSNAVLENAKQQLSDMIVRDKNRASIIIWSVGNETPISELRTNFMRSLITAAKGLDDSRLVSAALENHRSDDTILVNDPLGEYTDIVAVNEYLGWYGTALPDATRKLTWSVKYNKPFFISETGAEALGGYHADSLTRWSEEYQAWYYREQIAMMKRMPPSFVGLSPWVMVDFRSPRRNNPVYQQGWNNKGLISSKGQKKKAFYILKDYYMEMKRKFGE